MSRQVLILNMTRMGDLVQMMEVTSVDKYAYTSPHVQGIIPDSPNQPYDMHEVITRILDDDEFLEIQAAFVEGFLAPHASHQAAHARGERGRDDIQLGVPGDDAVSAQHAVVVGAPQVDFA